MAKLAQATSKYTVYAHFDADGTVEKPDVIGAVFGQTEGLLGQELDLRELQRTGRIGRIDVDIQTRGGKASGAIIIPSSLDASETALIAAAIETIERVGPCNAHVYTEKVEDVRIEKRKYVVERAKQILQRVYEEGGPEASEITEQIKEAVRAAEITEWNGMPAGPEVVSNDSVVLVEGRADVINLLRCGIKNAVAIGGTSISTHVGRLGREKEITVFLDGDRGGDLILKELAEMTDVDFVARAPTGKEVEELTKKEIYKGLRERVPFANSKANGTARDIRDAQEAREKERTLEAEEILDAGEPTKTHRKRKREDSEKSGVFREILEELTGTRAAYLLDDKGSPQGKVPVREMFNAMKEIDTYALVFDGEIDQKLVTFASNRGVRYIVGMRSTNRLRIPDGVSVLTLNDL